MAKALNHPLLHVLTLSHNLKSLLSVCMREEISLCLSPPLPPSFPHSILPPVIFVADEAEPNVYDRWDGRGKWCRPSPICICSVAGPALVSTWRQNTEQPEGPVVVMGAGGNGTQGSP